MSVRATCSTPLPPLKEQPTVCGIVDQLVHRGAWGVVLKPGTTTNSLASKVLPKAERHTTAGRLQADLIFAWGKVSDRVYPIIATAGEEVERIAASTTRQDITSSVA